MVAVLEREVPPPVVTVGARIDAQGVSHWSGSRANPLQVLNGVSLIIQRSRFVTLLGPSGCGKFILLCLIARLGPPTHSHILQDDKPISKPDPPHVVVLQDPMLCLWCRVRDNVALGLQACDVLGVERDRVSDALERVGLGDFCRALLHELSDGMTQRVALACALVNDSQLLVLDEPPGKLDSLTWLATQSKLVTPWQHARFSTVLVTHNVKETLFLTWHVVIFSPRPAHITAELMMDLPYPRHRSDPYLDALQHEALGHLGLGETWQMAVPS